MIKDKKKLEKKLRTTEKKLEDTRKDNDKIEQLKQNYTTNLKLSANCDLHVKKLQEELKEAKELAARLQTALDSNIKIESLQQALKDETELTAQLKTALDAKQRHIENRVYKRSTNSPGRKQIFGAGIRIRQAIK